MFLSETMCVLTQIIRKCVFYKYMSTFKLTHPSLAVSCTAAFTTSPVRIVDPKFCYWYFLAVYAKRAM